MNPDGVSYLDLSEDIASGRFAAAVNGHWSPAYPALLAAWLGLVSPHPYWEATAVHVLNGLLFLASMAMFEWFLRELAKSQNPNVKWALRLNDPSGRFAAYILFLWCAFALITIRVVTPDMLLSSVVWAIAALLVRIHSGRATSGSLIALGALLGLSYLTKSFMFPMALVILCASVYAMRRTPGAVRRHGIAIAAFVIVAAPQVLALSSDGNGIRFSDSGWLAYALKVNRYPKMWTGRPAGSGIPEHPIVQVASKPAMFVFATTERDRSYPVWNEPATWFRGMDPDFDADRQSSVVASNLAIAAGFALKVVLPLLIVIGLRKRGVPFSNWTVVGVTTIAIAGYMMLHVEPRLIGAWLVLLVVTVLAATPLDDGRRGRAGQTVVHAITFIGLISIATYVVDRVTTRRLNDGWNTPHFQWRVAQKVLALGAPSDSRVALIGDESDIYWARLSDVQVAVQIPLSEAPGYWRAGSRFRERYHRLMSRVGARAIVSSWTNPPDTVGEWSRVTGTMYSVSPLTDTNELEH